MNEATARIKINKLLEESGWRFFADGDKPANICLEPDVTLSASEFDDFGNDFEKTSKGHIDFLLLDNKGRPLIVLEAKSEKKEPLVGKEQARRYARSQNCRFIILSNGNLHYFWDIERGNPHIITSFPTPDSVSGYRELKPEPNRLISEQIRDDYIVRTQQPNYAREAAWQNETERPDFIRANNLRFLRPYQLKAVHALQRAVKNGNDRFLFEMATGTGKTLTAAAVIKLFLHSRNAQRVLFLVDRLELEEQARKVFTALLSADFKTLIYKENRDDWRRADIVVSTVQSLLFNNKYRQLFSPTDFDLVISDEAHRSIGGNARAVFDYFVGYKLGLTATPRDYLKGFNADNPTTRDPREAERRLLKDTYRTFGCESGQPTFRYSLLDGVKDGFLINPTVVDARTEITTQLLSEQGFAVPFIDESGEEKEEIYRLADFEKKFFSEATNQLFCQTFLEHALRDPISGEIGKSIIFAVSQNHAAKLTQILNEMADHIFPDKYRSDFAVQVTSHVADAQQFTINFTNNQLRDSGNFLTNYKTSKARICVTVGMMTTGYDCTDLLNLGMFRPIFSPTDFVQIKGRGTRKHDFRDQLPDKTQKEAVANPHKTAFKLFDFFANCEYFETEFNYDEVLQLPAQGNESGGESIIRDLVYTSTHLHRGPDNLSRVAEQKIGAEGMRIDRMLFERFEDTVKEDEFIVASIEAGEWDKVIAYINEKIFDKPEEYYNLDKLRKAAEIDRRLTLREILEKIFGFIPHFKSKSELLEEEFAKFIADHKPDQAEAVPAMKHYFTAYITRKPVRDAIDSREYTSLATNSAFSTRDFMAIPEKYRTLIPEYIKDYVLDQFAA